MPAEKHRKTLAVGSSNPTPNRRSTHTRRGRGFEKTEYTPADKRHKTLAAAPSISYHAEAFALARRGRHFQTKIDANGKASQNTRSRAVNRIHCQIDGAFELAEGRETLAVGPSEVTQIKWDAECTSQLIDLETTHACVITDLATTGSRHYPNRFHRRRMQSARNFLKVTPISWDAEFTSQHIDLKTTHACVITDPATKLAEGEASRQQKIRQPTSITRHSQPRHRSVTTTKHSHSLAEGGTSRQRQMPTEMHRNTLAAGPSIEAIAKSTEHSNSQRVARLLQSVRQRSPKLNGIPSPRAKNSSTWRRHTPVSSRIRRQTEVTIIIQIVSTAEECSQPGIFSRPVRQIRCQIDRAFALAEGGASRQKTDASSKASQDT
jgi:hypothetical protein